MPTFPTRSPGTWAPRIPAQFIEPLVVTVRELILRDQAEALAYVNTTSVALGLASITLQPFQHVFYSQREKSFYESRVSAFPLCMVQPRRTEAPTGEEERSIPELHEIVVQVAITGSDPDNLTLQIMRYIKAIDWMWRAASATDLAWNLNLSHTNRAVIDVAEHSFDLITADGPNSYFHEASIVLTAQFWEH